MDKPTAIIDKSLLQRICGEPKIQRDVLMNLLRGKYQLVVAFSLVDEVLANIADCPPGKDPFVIAEMKRQIDALHMCFLNEVWEIAFEELVLNKPLSILPCQNNRFLQNYAGLDLKATGFLEAAQARRQQRKEVEQYWKSQQNAWIPPGTFLGAASEKHFYATVAQDLRQRLGSPELKTPLLENLLGSVFRDRHPDDGERIQAGFDLLSDHNINSFPFTRNFLVVQLIYRYGPLTKIVNRDFPPPILDRGDQLNNLEDWQYVLSATLCERLLTGDEPMARVMQMLKANGLWNGDIVWIDKNDKDLANQISNRLL